jgi:hypothetical protein
VYALFGPARGSADGGGDDVGAVLKGGLVGGDEDVVGGLAVAAKDAVGAEDGVGGSSGEAKLVFLGRDNASDVGAVSLAVHGVVVWDGRVEAVVVVADEVGAKGNVAASTEAAAQSGMLVVDTSVNDGNLDALAGEALGAQLVDLGHDVGAKHVARVVALGALVEDGRGAVPADRLDDVVGDAVDLDRPHVFDSWKGGDAGGLGVGLVDVVELDGDSLEELVVELHAGGALGLDLVVEGVGVLAILELKDEGAGDAHLAGLEAGPGGQGAGRGREERHEEGGGDHGEQGRAGATDRERWVGTCAAAGGRARMSI